MKKQNGALAFIHHEAAGGVLLLAAAILAMILANSPLAGLYGEFLDTRLTIKLGDLGVDKPLLHWINDGLMAIFFFLVGLEIKRELLVGELASARQAALPLVGALGGMVMPALIYAYVNASDPVALHGWAIPTATDIAFAVTVLSLVPRVPPALKIFLLALAIIDDLGAIIIIALFYTANLSLTALTFASVGLAVLFVLNRNGTLRTAPYVLAGLFVWLCVLKSGVHATLAGVATAFAIPIDRASSGTRGLAAELQESLHGWVTFGVLPLFAFANAGVSLAGVTLSTLLAPIPLGIAAGLVLGKPIGVFGFSSLAIAAGIASRPEGTTARHLLGAGLIAGIGFTMSLFIGMLAFPGSEHATEVRLGVLVGSVLSAIAGYLLLRSAEPATKSAMRPADDHTPAQGRKS